MTIVLKHLAREFQAQPRRIRMILRQNDYKPHNGRWTWNDDDPQLIAIRTLLGSSLSKSLDEPTPTPTRRQPKQSTRTT